MSRYRWMALAGLAGVSFAAGVSAATGVGAAAGVRDATGFTDLPGSAAGAQVIQVPLVQGRIDQLQDVVYAQILGPHAVRGLRMSLLVPHDDRRKPAIVYFPGGGFTSADYAKYLQMRMALAAAGFVVASVEYRVVPDRYPAPVVDGKAAVRYLRAHADALGIDPARIGVLGDSAGGYLAQMVALTGGAPGLDRGDHLEQSSAVQAAATLYGISNLLDIGAGFPAAVQQVHRSPAVTEALLLNGPAFAAFPGAVIDADPARALAASPMGHLDGAKPPFLILHGSADKLVSPAQSRQLYEGLRRRGDRAEYVLVEGAGHGDQTWYQPAVIDRVVRWFVQTLGAPAAAAVPRPERAGDDL